MCLRADGKALLDVQAELEEAQRLLKKEMMAAERTCATWEQAQAELKKVGRSTPRLKLFCSWFDTVSKCSDNLKLWKLRIQSFEDKPSVP